MRAKLPRRRHSGKDSSSKCTTKRFGSDFKDNIVVDNAQINNVYGGVGFDEILGINSAKLSSISGGLGDGVVNLNKTTITGMVVGNDGDDTITVENGARVVLIQADEGDDTITVTGAGTTVTEYVQGNEDADTIRILDGATVNQYVSGGRGENPNVYGGAQDSDKNTVIIKNATVKGDVEGSTRGGDSEIEISGSTINGKVVGSSDGTKASKLTIEDGSVDFSKVEKITSLELGGADKNLNITLTKYDIFRNNELKIDGENCDRVTLDRGGYTAGSSTGGYTKYTATYSGATISVEIKDDIVVIL